MSLIAYCIKMGRTVRQRISAQPRPKNLGSQKNLFHRKIGGGITYKRNYIHYNLALLQCTTSNYEGAVGIKGYYFLPFQRSNRQQALLNAFSRQGKLPTTKIYSVPRPHIHKKLAKASALLPLFHNQPQQPTTKGQSTANESQGRSALPPLSKPALSYHRQTPRFADKEKRPNSKKQATTKFKLLIFFFLLSLVVTSTRPTPHPAAPLLLTSGRGNGRGGGCSHSAPSSCARP